MNMRVKPFLSVVVPAYNEAHNIRAGAIESVYNYLSKQKYAWEVLIVDDGSIDETVKLAEKFSRSHKNFIVLKERHRGKGGTVISGMLEAKGDLVLFTDMDQSTSIDQVAKLLPKLKDYDIAIGSRVGREGAPLFRKLMAYGFALIRLLVLRLPYRDTQCGFKVFRKDAAIKIFGKMKNLLERKNVHGSSLSAGFDVEILYLARKMGLKVAEVPVTWHYKEGTKKNPLIESWIGFKGVVAVRLKSLIGYYGILPDLKNDTSTPKEDDT